MFSFLGKPKTFNIEYFDTVNDEEVVYQSHRLELYQQSFAELQQRGLVYPCFCSRRQLQQFLQDTSLESQAYPGICENLNEEQISKQNKPAIRLAWQLI